MRIRTSVCRLAGAVFLLGAISHSWADAIFTFDPNDLLDLYTTGQSGDYAPAQANPRFVYDGTFANVAATYTDHPAAPYAGGSNDRWDGNDAYYADWLEGLGTGEGVRSFNIWVTTAGYLGNYGNMYSRIDVQQDLFSGVNNTSIWGVATASGDWNARLVTVYSNATWGASFSIQWYTTNTASYLRPGGVDLDPFSFSVSDIWTGTTNNPLEVVAGGQYRMFFGSTGVIFDDQNWGANSGLAAYSYQPGQSQWQGELYVTAQTPEPSTFLLIGLTGVALLLRRKR